MRPGFTLAELLVSVTLMAVVLSGLFSLQDTLLRDQGKIMRDIAVRNQADYARRMLLRDIGEATIIQSPPRAAVDTFSQELVGWKNLDPFNVSCDCTGGTICLPNSFCTPACAGLPQSQNWTSLVDLPKDGVGFPDAGGGIAADGARLFGNDTTWFRYCRTGDGRLMYYRGVVMAAANTVVCPPTMPCGDGCGALAAPNCLMEQVAGTPVNVSGGFGLDLFKRRGGRSDWIETNIHIATATAIGGLMQGTSVQVVLSAQMLRGTR